MRALPLLVLALAAAPAAAQTVAARDIPPAVIAVVQKAAPGITITEAEFKARDGRNYYDVEGKAADGSEAGDRHAPGVPFRARHADPSLRRFPPARWTLIRPPAHEAAQGAPPVARFTPAIIPHPVGGRSRAARGRGRAPVSVNQPRKQRATADGRPVLNAEPL